jgi:hypothetical protein
VCVVVVVVVARKNLGVDDWCLSTNASSNPSALFPNAFNNLTMSGRNTHARYTAEAASESVVLNWCAGHTEKQHNETADRAPHRPTELLTNFP